MMNELVVCFPVYSAVLVIPREVHVELSECISVIYTQKFSSVCMYNAYRVMTAKCQMFNEHRSYSPHTHTRIDIYIKIIFSLK